MEEMEIDEIVRDLRHLQSFVVSVDGKGKDGANLRIEVTFGLHTISESCPAGSHNLADENGKPRLFSEVRYAFSLGLPELAKRMIAQNYYCWESHDRNRATNFAVIDAAPGRVSQLFDAEHQVVFFYLYPLAGELADVRLTITSCYSRLVAFSKIKRRYNLLTVLRKCLYEQRRMP